MSLQMKLNKQRFWLFIKMCYYDVGTRIPFYVTPSQIYLVCKYQIDNYSDTTSEFFYVLIRDIVILRWFKVMIKKYKSWYNDIEMSVI